MKQTLNPQQTTIATLKSTKVKHLILEYKCRELGLLD